MISDALSNSKSTPPKQTGLSTSFVAGWSNGLQWDSVPGGGGLNKRLYGLSIAGAIDDERWLRWRASQQP